MEKYLWIVTAINLLKVLFAMKEEGLMSPYVHDLQNGQKLYEDFIAKYNRTFTGELDYQNRYSNFMRTLKNVNRINSIQGSVKVGLNQFADFSATEYKKTMDHTEKKVDPELALMLNKRDPNLKSLFKIAKSYG